MFKKKILPLLFILVIIITNLALPASAEGFTYEFENGSHCKSLLMLNVDTDTIAYSMNADERLPIASTTKIMTYIIAYEYISDIYSTKITVPQSVKDDLEGTGSSLADVKVGEEFTVIQLLNLIMIPSGNDAALTLAKYVDSLGITMSDVLAKRGTSSTKTTNESDSSEDEDSSVSVDEIDNTVLTFVDLMNLKAAELGCNNTHFTNPHGLHDENHYSTARDLMTITKYATKLPEFTNITRTTVYNLEATNMSEARRVTTTNSMLLQSQTDYYYQYCTGIKTGSHSNAGYCIVSSATYNGYSYIVVALGSPMYNGDGPKITTNGAMLDSRELFRWAFTKLETKTIVASGDLLGDVTLKYAWKQDKLQLVSGGNVSVILPSSVESSSIMKDLNVPETVEAPVKKGEVIGTATLTYADEVIATIDVVAAESVDRSEIIMTLEQGKAVLTSKWFLIVVGIIAFLILIYILLIFIYKRKQKKLKKNVKKFRDM